MYVTSDNVGLPGRPPSVAGGVDLRARHLGRTDTRHWPGSGS